MRRILGLLLLTSAVAAGAAERPDLTGTIYDQDENPHQGAAVYMYTAKPRTGSGVVCPSCYMDCAKRDTTGADGTFTIPSLDPTLLFRVLVVAEGFTPMFIENVDPLESPVRAKLVALDPARLKPGHVLRGRVLDPLGQPVVGAKIEPYARHSGTSTQYGGLRGIDPMSATNPSGEFAITCEEPDLTLSIKVEARGLAPENFRALTAGETVHELHLGYGVTVSGTVEKDGQPVPGILMGIVQTDRGSGTFLGEIEIATDDKGRFSFTNVPPNDEFAVYGQLNDGAAVGAFPVKLLRTKDDESIVDAGVLTVEPGHRLSGRVVLSDGKPLPDDVRVMISREVAWDWLEVEVGEDGSFEAANLPGEEYSINCRVSGYHVSPKNYSLDPLNQFSLMGRIDQDITGLTLLLDPGDHQWEQAPQEASTRYGQLKNEQIRGAAEPAR